MNKLILFTLLVFGSGCATQSDNTSKKDNNIVNASLTTENELVKVFNGSANIYGDAEIFSKPAKGYIVVYAPTLADMNAFEHPLHVAGMYTYFESEKGKKVETILVSKDPKHVFDEFINRNKAEHSEMFSELSFVHDTDGKLIELLKIDGDHLNHAGIAITYNSSGEQLFVQEDYKCQGEKLQRMHQHFYPRELSLAATGYEIEVGKKIPPQLTTYCSEYLGKKNMLITFYPAPLSHACSIQMRTFNDMAAENLESKDLKAIAVSIGTLQQVESWKMHQPTQSVELVADTSGMFSNSFNSLLKDEHGVIYSDRTVFLIDKTGVVRYINKDYDVAADLDVLEQEIKKL